MVEVSDAWKDIHQRFILPETFVEVTCELINYEAQSVAEVAVETEAMFSDSTAVTSSGVGVYPHYATLERNLWVLDGSRNVVPAEDSPVNRGYASAEGVDSHPGLHIMFPSNVSLDIPGLTITWSDEYGEYPRSFHVQARRGTQYLDSVDVENNTSHISTVNLSLVDCDHLIIYVSDWCLPDHRVRIDRVTIGQTMIFTKRELTSYTHEMHGDLTSAELPQNYIKFSVDNLDGKWNPDNPQGISQFLSEQQKVNVRYGMDVNGVTEWIKGGTFYLSEWRAESNGLEASFVARDVFDFLLNKPYGKTVENPLAWHLRDAFALFETGTSFNYHVDESVFIPGGLWGVSDREDSAAEVIQMCANAARCVIWIDRNGEPHVAPLNKTQSDYVIGSALSYSHPEITLTKPLKSVTVRYGTESAYTLPVGASGEDQTVENPMIYDYEAEETEQQAIDVAEWVRDTLAPRKIISGAFRADPRLDLYDVVTVESKYGALSPIAITGIVYNYSGSFHATYTGRVIGGESNVAVLGQMILGQTILG